MALPEQLAQRCVESAAAQELMLAGFDVRKTPGGVWWCLEVNPVPIFIPYEAATGVPIGAAILKVFSRA
jgi:D-alanine-D-alanine ligase-like ATP-grasp enzyme